MHALAEYGSGVYPGLREAVADRGSLRSVSKWSFAVGRRAVPVPDFRSGFAVLSDGDAEARGKAFIAAVTSGDDVAEDARDEIADDEQGGFTVLSYDDSMAALLDEVSDDSGMSFARGRQEARHGANEEHPHRALCGPASPRIRGDGPPEGA